MLVKKLIYVFGLSCECRLKNYEAPISNDYGLRLQRWDAIEMGVRLCL